MPFWRMALWVIGSVGWSEALYSKEVTVPGDYPSIQAAIDAIQLDPTVGDTVLVAVGTYSENIELISGVTLRGAETARTRIEAADTKKPIFNLNNLNNVTLKNMNWRSAATGATVTGGSNIKIVNNVINLGGDALGVNESGASSVEVTNNTFYGNATAISRSSDSVTVKNNIFTNNNMAIEGGSTNVTHNCFYRNIESGIVGSNQVGDDDPLFVDVAEGDFHLKADSPCIDVGEGTDVIDATTADMGAYGGERSDLKLFPVKGVSASDISATVGTSSIEVSWSPNESYLVTRRGGYKLYYDSDGSGAPYTGTDGVSGTKLSPIDVGRVGSYRLTELSPRSGAPDIPRIVAVTPGNERLQVSWEAVSGATGYQLYYGISDVGEKSVHVPSGTVYTISELSNGVNYQVAVSAVAVATYVIAVTAYDGTGASNHDSDYSDEVSVTLGTPHESERSLPMRGTPELIEPVPNLPNEGCFIATAAYGYYAAPEVQRLRDFRDKLLLTSPAGRLFVQLYYRVSPHWAAEIRANEGLKQGVRLLLSPLVATAGLLTSVVGMWLVLAIALFGVGRRVVGNRRFGA